MKNLVIARGLIAGFAITTPKPVEAKAANVVKTAKAVEKWIKDSCKKDSKCNRAANALMDKHCSRKWWEECFFDAGPNGGKFKANGDRKWLVTGEFLDAKMKR